MILRGEEAWAEARFAESHWNQEDPECPECGGAIEDEECVDCGEPCVSDAVRRRRNAEARAEYLNECRRDRDD